MSSFKNKTVATILAAFGGTLGLHRFYLEGSSRWRPWLYPIYFFSVSAVALRYLVRVHPDLGSDWQELLHPALIAAFVPSFFGFVEALVFALTSDANWDRRWNAGASRTSHSGALVIFVAVITLAFGATMLMSALAISFQFYYETLQGIR